LNAQLTGKTGIRVNCAFEPPFLRSCKLVLTDSIWSGVAPGPIWTPLMFVHPCTWIYCAR
jgi:hypothetical protein